MTPAIVLEYLAAASSALRTARMQLDDAEAAAHAMLPPPPLPDAAPALSPASTCVSHGHLWGPHGRCAICGDARPPGAPSRFPSAAGGGMSAPALAPCPRCGKPAQAWREACHYWTGCRKCGFWDIPRTSPGEAAAAWNGYMARPEAPHTASASPSGRVDAPAPLAPSGPPLTRQERLALAVRAAWGFTPVSAPPEVAWAVSAFQAMWDEQRAIDGEARAREAAR